MRWSRPSISQRPDASRSSSSVARSSAAAPSTEEFAPGYKAPTLAHTLGPLRPSIVRDMQLERRGVKFVRPDPRLVSLGAGRAGARLLDRRAADGGGDPRRSRRRTRRSTPSSAPRWAGSAAFSADLLEMTPPSIDAPSAGELWTLLKTGRQVPSARQEGRVQPAAVGTDGGRRSGGRMVRDGSAAGERGRARESRHLDGTVVGGHRAPSCCWPPRPIRCRAAAA